MFVCRGLTVKATAKPELKPRIVPAKSAAQALRLAGRLPAPQGLLPEALALFRQVGCREQQGYDGLHGVFVAVAPAHVLVTGGPAPALPSPPSPGQSSRGPRPASAFPLKAPWPFLSPVAAGLPSGS